MIKTINNLMNVLIYNNNLVRREKDTIELRLKDADNIN